MSGGDYQPTQVSGSDHAVDWGMQGPEMGATPWKWQEIEDRIIGEVEVVEGNFNGNITTSGLTLKRI
jgi:hypothetical protein